MKFTAERDALVGAIAFVHVGKRNDNIPILANVLLTAREGNLWLLSHALDYCAEMSCPAEVETAGSTTVAAHDLAGLLGSAPEGSQVVCELDGSRLKVKFGRSVYRLGTLPATDYPNALACDPTDKIDLTSEQALRLFGEPEFATDNGMSAAYRAGIYLHNAKSKTVSTVATCGVQLARTSIEGLPPVDADVIVTQQTAREIVRAAKAGPVHLEWSENLLVVESGAWRFTTKLIDSQFPEYEQLIGDFRESPRFLFDRKSLLHAVERLSLVADKGTIEFEWDVEPSLARLHVGGDAGLESVDCVAPGMDAGSFKVPPSQFVSLLKAVDSDVVEIFFSGPGRPLQIQIPTRPHYVALQTLSA
ncbi:MAG: DNA polymerase III subunit beta [Pseudolabrys sp.]